MQRYAFMAAALVVGFPARSDVLTYHHGPERHGLYVEPALDARAAARLHLDPAFKAQFAGAVYAQPLYWQAGHLLIVATETNHVYALHADSGAIAWQASLPPAAPLADSACGNIDPEGITGTPVIDPATATLYLDAQVLRAGKPHHEIYGLSLRDGRARAGWPIDVDTELAQRGAEFSAMTQGERGALTFWRGHLYVPFGGKYGDCRPYRGTVVEIDPASPPRLAATWRTRASGGGIWAVGGLTATGSALYATTGNTFGAASWFHGDHWGDGDSVIRLTPGLADTDDPKNFFAPADWPKLDRRDLDLGGTAAIPLDVPAPGGPAHRVLALGKDGKAYLLDGDHLGGIGGQLAAVSLSNGEIKTAPAVLPESNRTLVAFANEDDPECGGEALTMIAIRSGTSPAIAPLWCVALHGRGAPIITVGEDHRDPIVWVVGAEGDNRLHGFLADTGKPVFEGTVAMQGLHHFQTLIAANGRLYVAADGTVYAWSD